VSGAGQNCPPKIEPGIKLWLSLSGRGVFGEGKRQLLDAINRKGSLQAAADSLGISYRKAWGDLREAERTLGICFLERHRGGSDGGESRLTEDGRKWLKEYGRFHDEVLESVKRAHARWEKRMGK
jgi:molybdate transport system regulatory protein